MAEGVEQNRSEDATPFKLRHAREKGMVARGLDLSFVASLLATIGFALVAGPALVATLRMAMIHALGAGIQQANDPHAAAALAGISASAALRPLILFGGTLVALVLFVEIVQLRGLVFSATPLTPDFTRLNPATGFKRLASGRMLKEAAKSIVKMAGYTAVAVLAGREALAGASTRIDDATDLADALWSGGSRMMFLFIAVAAAVAVIDQALSRGAFAKQMRMSRREVTREVTEREGEPRIKNKRKQLHADFVKHAKGLAQLPGSDMLLVNPRHVAVALSYRTGEHAAPVVTAKGAERQAAILRRAAATHRVPIVSSPSLARALFKECDLDEAIRPAHFHAVADLYHKLNETKNA